MTKKKIFIEQLTELQITLGYKNDGKTLDDIAVLGFGGEAGEVLNELSTPKDEYAVASKLSQFTIAGQSLDFRKKRIRDKHEPAVDFTYVNRDALIEELADQFYYQNALCINLGITQEDLAAILLQKVAAKMELHPDLEDKR